MTDRDDRRKYEADVAYEVWRSGGDSDAIDYDRLDDARHDGVYPEDAALAELRRQRNHAAEDIEMPEGER